MISCIPLSVTLSAASSAAVLAAAASLINRKNTVSIIQILLIDHFNYQTTCHFLASSFISSLGVKLSPSMLKGDNVTIECNY